LREKSSKHITIGLKYLPAIAARLRHCRDFGSHEPFDFLRSFDWPGSLLQMSL
jgi:hypothetical protein